MTEPNIVRFVRSCSWLAGACALTACSNTAAPSEKNSGSVAFALVAHTADHSYRLRDATFDITRAGGELVASLDSETDPDAERLTQRLDPGGYHVQLQDDWLLARIEPSGPDTIVDAFLESPMSGGADFEIIDDATTTVPYQFVTDGIPIGFGTGEVAVVIGVREELPSTRLELSTAEPSIATELGTTTDIQLTLAASDGFDGLVGLSGSLLDNSGEPMTGWALSVEPATFAISDGESASATATLTIPIQNRGLSAVARFIANSAAGHGTRSVDVPITALNQYTIDLAVSAQGQCVYPPAGTVTLTQGTTLRWLNVGTESWSIHTNGSFGCPHQPQSSVTLAGETYDCPQLLTGSGSWYCHSPGPQLPGLNIEVVAP